MLAAFCWGLLVAPAARATDSPDPGRNNRIIVKFKIDAPDSGVSGPRRLPESIEAIHRRVQVRSMRALFARRRDGSAGTRGTKPGSRSTARAARGPRPAAFHDVFAVELASAREAREVLDLYADDPNVDYAQWDHFHLPDALPNDPYLTSSGAWGQPYGDLWGLARIRAPEAWSISQGEGVVVAVVDTGVDYLHPDIERNIWVNAGEDLNANGLLDADDWNGIDDDANGFVDDIVGFDFAHSIDAEGDGRYDSPDDVIDADPLDDSGHGTHVAGTIAAVGDNGIGIIGVAPKAKIMALKGFPAEGPGRDSDLWRAVLYAAENGASVINTSWSCSFGCTENPLAESVLAEVHALGVVLVTSASNRSRDIVTYSPERLRETIAVASSGEDDRFSNTFSNRGWLIDVAAPGGGPPDLSPDLPPVVVPRRNILSLRASASDPEGLFVVGGDYLRFSGTSMAAPHVSGLVALLRSADPSLTPDALRRIIRQSAVDIGAAGHDGEVGAGRIDAYAALTLPPLPDMDARITSPGPGAIVRPYWGEVEIRGSADGDDLDHYVLDYAHGQYPDTWLPIGEPVHGKRRDGLLGVWGIEGLSQGAYIVRLTALAWDGTAYQEFAPVSIEGSRFAAISSPGRPADLPVISGDRVAWQSRRKPERPEEDDGSMNVFVSDLRSGAEHVIAAEPGEQRWPSISGDVIAWQDTRFDATQPEVYACRLDPRSGACPEVAAAPGVRAPLAPIAAAGRVYWSDSTLGSLDLRGCGLDESSRDCAPLALGLEPSRRTFLRGDGRSLIWLDSSAGHRFGTCVVDTEIGACHETRLADPVQSFSRPAVSGDTIAWVGFDLRRTYPLHVCALDRETGACPAIVVGLGVPDDTPALSDERLVWEQVVGDQETDVFFCEFDAARERCPVQRLTAEMSRQHSAAIDRDRVVWVDEREGPGRVMGFTLPRIVTKAAHRVPVGKRLVTPVRVRGPGGESIALEIEAVDGETIADRGAHLDVHGARRASWRPPGRTRDADAGGSVRATLSWVPAEADVGRHLVTLMATTRGGIETRTTIEIEVVAVPPPPAVPRVRTWLRRLAWLLALIRGGWISV